MFNILKAEGRFSVGVIFKLRLAPVPVTTKFVGSTKPVGKSPRVVTLTVRLVSSTVASVSDSGTVTGVFSNVVCAPIEAIAGAVVR